MQCRKHRRLGFNPWVGKIPWRRKWQPTPLFLPEKSLGQRNLAGYSPKGLKGSDTTEAAEQAHMCGLNKRDLFSHNFWKLKVQDQNTSIVRFWWGLFWLSDGCLLTVSHMAEKMSKLSGISYKDTNATTKSSPHHFIQTQLPPKGHTPNTIKLGVIASTCAFQRPIFSA